MSQWYVYIVRCADNSLYPGITTDVERRVREHNGGTQGAAYTRGRRPVTLVYYEACKDRADAARRENEIKAMSKLEKEDMLSGTGVSKSSALPSP